MTLPSGRLATLPAGSGAYPGLPSPARCHSMKLVRSPHSLGEADFRLQFTPKYRRDVFRETATRYGFAIHAIEFGPDHAHIFVGACKNLAVSELVRLLKGTGSRWIRQRCWSRVKSKLWGDAFWTAGYFYRSVGSTTNEAILYYLEHSQRKHWKAVDHDIYLQSKQKPITEYVT
jgi:putative transposase